MNFARYPVHEVLSPRYPPLRYLAQFEEDGYFSSLRSRVVEGGVKHLGLTFEELLKRTPFAERMKKILKVLEENYQSPVDMEFTVKISDPGCGETHSMYHHIAVPATKFLNVQRTSDSAIELKPTGCNFLYPICGP